MKYKNKKPEIHPSKRHLTKEDVERAIRNTNSNRMASRFLSVSVPNWKKWATTYMDESGVSYYERHLNKCGKGVTKVKNLKNALADVLSGKLPPWHMKKRDIKESLIIEGYFKEECNRCGFCERRNLDLRIPLLLFFKDLNKKNVQLNNMELVCYNCYFMTIGDVFDNRQIGVLESFEKRNSTYIDLDLPKEFQDQFYLEMVGAVDHDPEPELDKEIEIIEDDFPELSKSEEDYRDEDFGMDLVSFLSKP